MVALSSSAIETDGDGDGGIQAVDELSHFL